LSWFGGFFSSVISSADVSQNGIPMVRVGRLWPAFFVDVVFVAPIAAFAYNEPGIGNMDLALQISVSNERKDNARSFQNLSERPKESGNFPEIAPEATHASTNQAHL
jgi:hypothetical protein